MLDNINKVNILILAISDVDLLLAKQCYSIINNQQNSFKPYLKDNNEKSSVAIRLAFQKQHAILAIGSSAIVIRSIALLIKDKKNESPVLSLNSDGKAVSILLGATKGGDLLAKVLSDYFSCVIAGTGPGFKLRLKNLKPNLANSSILGEELGWRWNKNINVQDFYKHLENNSLDIDYKSDCKALPFYYDDDNRIKSQEKNPINAPVKKPIQSTEITRKITREKLISTIYCNIKNEESAFVVYPPVLTIGIGCIRNADPKKMYDWIISKLKLNGLALQSVSAIATISDKADEPAILEFSKKINKPLRFFYASELKEINVANPSNIVKLNIGTPSVAEAASLAVAGYNKNNSNARLLVNKIKNDEVTLAISISKNPLLIPNLLGLGTGTVIVVGIGPGGKEFFTLEALNALENGDAFFGYSEYIKRVKEIIPSRNFFEYKIGEEIKRVNDCIEYSIKGKVAVLVCSGDASIYGLASLLCSYTASSNNPLVKGLQIKVIAGISAMQLASARFGGILNHDFCALSLSDLLTPIELIKKRIIACAKADLVVAFYNPKSKKRVTLLNYAMDTMLKYRQNDCPVIIAKNLGKLNEDIKMSKLRDFESINVDMNTIVICGNSHTSYKLRAHGDCIWTPRGYPANNIIN